MRTVPTAEECDQATSALLDLYLPDGSELARIGGLWIEAACRELAPGWWRQLQAALPLGEQGVPGGVYAHIAVTPRPWQGRVHTEAFSPGALGRALESLESRPLNVSMQLRELDHRGLLPEDSSGGSLTVSVSSLEDHPDWVQLQAVGHVPGPEGELARPDVSARWARVIRAAAGSSGAVFGQVCDDTFDGRTALDRSLPRGGQIQSILEGRETLRGYSWITICPPELAARLGGAASLRGSGAFWDVAELPTGGVFLQATPDFAGYDDAAMVRVFEVLAPVLPAGLPEPEMMEEYRYRLVWRDAGWYRAAGVAFGAPMPLGLGAGDALAAAMPGAGTARDTPEGYELGFGRRIDHDQATVWRVLTDPAAVDRWLGWHPGGMRGPLGRLDPLPGGLVVQPYCYPLGKGPRIVRNTIAGTVTRVKEPECLEYVIPGMDGPEARTRWSVRADSGQTLLALRYEFQVRDRLPELMADWHCRLDGIALLLNGAEPERAWEPYPGRLSGYQTALRRIRQ
jgi:uncharacterized protein YndB with AHSA1/START domain